MTRREGAHLALLAALGAFLLGWGIGSRPLGNPDESRYAEIAREMWESSDWIVPRLVTIPYVDKPPLLYWLTAPLIGLLGPGELAPRLVSFASAMAVLVMIYFAARRRSGHEVGMWSGAIWATSALPLVLAHMVSIDMVLTALVTGSVLLFRRALEDGGGGALPGWALAGLAFLAKGPVGFVLAALAGAAFAVAHRRVEWRRLSIPLGVPLCLAISIPWFVALQVMYPPFFGRFFLHENLGGFFTADVHHPRPILAASGYALAGFLPWTVLLLPAAWRRRFEWKDPDQRFLLLWALMTVAFFTLSAAKLPTYLLPAMPAMALWGGGLLARTQGSRADALAYGAILVAGAATAVGFAVSPGIRTHWGLIPFPSAGIVAAALVAGGAAIGVASLLRGHSKTAAAAVIGALAIALIPAHHAVRVAIDDVRSTRELVRRHRELLQGRPVLIMGRSDYSTSYYLRRPVHFGHRANELEFGSILEPTDRWALGPAEVEEFFGRHPRSAALVYRDDFPDFGSRHLGLREVDRLGPTILFTADR